MGTHKSIYHKSTRMFCGSGVNHGYKAVSMPIYQASQFGAGSEYHYSRLGNPNMSELEHVLTDLEDGVGAVVFSSGMAAIAGVAGIFSEQTHYFVQGCYGGTSRLLKFEASRKSLDYQTLTPKELLSQPLRGPGVLWLETPTNPFLNEYSISEIRQWLPSEIILVVDNTLATPALQQPLKHGADLVVHSFSKSINGHCDVIGGSVVARNQQFISQLRKYRTTHGNQLDPFAAWLTLRGIQTLFVRQEHASKTASLLARKLCGRPEIAQLYYPGLLEDRGHDGQMKSGGSVLSMRLHRDLDPKQFWRSLHLIRLAPSYGGTHTLINQCALMSHESLSPVEKKAIDLTEQFFRLSVGLEHPDDLLVDLTQALEKMTNVNRKQTSIC